jgi:hypothetical protein
VPYRGIDDQVQSPLVQNSGARLEGSVGTQPGILQGRTGKPASDRDNDDWFGHRGKAVYQFQKSQWDTIETTCSLGAFAWASKHFASPAAESDKLISATDRTAVKVENVAHGFSAGLAGTAIELGIDHFALPNDQRMEGTVLADWIIAPMFLASRGRWIDKVGWIVSVHMAGRLVDHFRQPGRHF